MFKNHRPRNGRGVNMKTSMSKDGLVTIPLNASDAYHMGYAQGYADGRSAAPRWVRCEDELPEPNVSCLVCDKDGACAVGYYRQDAKAWDSPYFGWVEHEDGVFYDDDLPRIGKVVAWMPLPEPPKEDE